MNVMESIRTIMLVRGMTRSQLAEVIGKSTNHVDKMLRGDSPITTAIKDKISEALGTDWETIVRLQLNIETSYRKAGGLEELESLLLKVK